MHSDDAPKFPLAAKGFFSYAYSKKKTNNILLLASSEDEANKLYQQLLFFSCNETNIYYLPSLDTTPYDRLSPNPEISALRAKVLADLGYNKEKCILVTNCVNHSYLFPPTEVIKDTVFDLHPQLDLNAKKLIDYLSLNGYIRSPTASYCGEFAHRGEIIDVVMAGNKGYRISFDWHKVESIKSFDIDTQISAHSLSSLRLYAASEVLLNETTINNFKKNYLSNFGYGDRLATSSIQVPLYESLIEGRKFPGYENLLPLFYDNLCTLSNYLDNPIIIYDNFCLHFIKEYENSFQDFYIARQKANISSPANYYPALTPDKICLNYIAIKKILDKKENIHIVPENSEFAYTLDLTPASLDAKSSMHKIFSVIKEKSSKIAIICYMSRSSLEALKNFAKEYDFPCNEISSLTQAKIGVVNFARISLTKSFASDKYLFFAEQEVVSEKRTDHAKNTRKLKNILTELDNIVEGELIVHSAHGIGQFLQIENISVGGKPHDCLKILYAENARLYIPVENIDVLKKYGSTEAQLDKLGNASWQRRKSELKNRIGEIAKKLLATSAARKNFVISGFELKDDLYEQFCRKFPFAETEDQLAAIDEIKQDLTSGKLMDRLICGDVGYGKTEVAMRAAFMVASSNSIIIELENTKLAPQVAIIAPTTILCKQHYVRFKERFSEFGFNVVQLSRLIKPAEARKTKEAIKNGLAHIIIGTHALLSSSLKFANLKMVIIDEEQHFGVSQKERLKELKSGAHVLALSATPIPRTLQMSMVGLKDLSLISTPPLDRLPVRTSVMPFDEPLIREALLREHLRGGKSFYVCPRIADIEEVEKKLKKLVPELKYRIAHGQMPPSLVDEIMTDFYEGKFDILLSTTIIESGIDVVSANTIIIHHADKLGLSQLYQLRGRVGRGKIRGYAYLTISNKIATKIASRRLEIMQHIDSLGAGFTIASHDMDLRGFGNLVGDEQSGQIKEVGVELYQEMLDEAIANLGHDNDTNNGAPPSDNQGAITPSINLSLPIYIAENYVADTSLRLALYRRIGDLKNAEEVDNFKNEMIDRFGPIKAEFNNLLEVVKIKQLCIANYIESIDSGERGFLIKFMPKENVSEMIFNFIQKYPHHTKLKPDNKLAVIKTLTQENTLLEVNKFFEEFSQ